MLRRMVVDVLDEEGLETAEADNGADALHIIESVRPDGIVLDLTMPFMEGQTFLRRCEALPTPERPPVIAMSADPKALREVEYANLRARIPKPFDLDRFLRAVATMVSQPRLTSGPPPTPEPGTSDS